MAGFRLCIFESRKTGRRFLECVDKTAKERLNQLNRGRKDISERTKAQRPYKLVYSESYKTAQECRERSKFLRNEKALMNDALNRRSGERRRSARSVSNDRRRSERRRKERRKSLKCEIRI